MRRGRVVNEPPFYRSHDNLGICNQTWPPTGENLSDLRTASYEFYFLQTLSRTLKEKCFYCLDDGKSH